MRGFRPFRRRERANAHEHDVIRLLRALPERGLAAGDQGTTVHDYRAPGAPYPVEFCHDRSTSILVDVHAGDFEVAWRADASGS